MRIIALVLASLFATTAALAQTIRFYHHDAQGNLIAMTDDQAQVVWRAEPAPFADYTSHPPEHPQRFLDRPQEPHGLFEIGARWYDPHFGRFMTPDPMSFTGADLANPQSLNRYAYALNNPYRFHDTSGEVPVETVLDVIDIVHSSYELWDDPSWANAGFLAWSVGATFVPYVPGAWAAKGIKHGASVADAASLVTKVEKGVVATAAKGGSKARTESLRYRTAQSEDQGCGRRDHRWEGHCWWSATRSARAVDSDTGRLQVRSEARYSGPTAGWLHLRRQRWQAEPASWFSNQT